MFDPAEQYFVRCSPIRLYQGLKLEDGACHGIHWMTEKRIPLSSVSRYLTAFTDEASARIYSVLTIASSVIDDCGTTLLGN